MTFLLLQLSVEVLKGDQVYLYSNSALSLLIHSFIHFYLPYIQYFTVILYDKQKRKIKW